MNADECLMFSLSLLHYKLREVFFDFKGTQLVACSLPFDRLRADPFRQAQGRPFSTGSGQTLFDRLRADPFSTGSEQTLFDGLRQTLSAMFRAGLWERLCLGKGHTQNLKSKKIFRIIFRVQHPTLKDIEHGSASINF
jgi:hypothetical protein